MKKLTGCFLFFLFCVLILQAQNLVVNSDFSTYFKCPLSFNQYNNNNVKDFLPGWIAINKSTPDFFHRCSQNSDVGIPDNFAGSTEPYIGDGYIGLILRVDAETYPYSSTYSEHITGFLQQPLVKGRNYLFTMYYAFAQNSGIKSNGIGVYFSAEKPVFQDYYDYYEFSPQLMLHQDSIMDSVSGWKKLSAVYTAEGGEIYLTIGNYLAVSQSKIQRNSPLIVNDTRFFAYYYIDAVSLTEIDDTSDVEPTALLCVVQNNQKDSLLQKNSVFSFQAGDIYTLQNVFFDFEKSRLRAESYAELDKVLAFLKSNTLVFVRITGHTDNVGSESFNQELSEKRAKAVLEYFYSMGISLNRMTFKGMGCKMPLTENDTEWGRQQNRRVELEFYIP